MISLEPGFISLIIDELGFEKIEDFLQPELESIFDDTELSSSIRDLILKKVWHRPPTIDFSHNQEFTYIDLFSGIGAFRLALEAYGGKCLGFSEISKQAIAVYKNNFNTEAEFELGDITKVETLPFKDVDMVVAGVPCQSWSIAGKNKGFEDPRGKLWEDTIRLIGLSNPKCFILENVKGLSDPRNDKEKSLILNELKKLGYKVYSKVLSSQDFGVPQNDQDFFVGFKE